MAATEFFGKISPFITLSTTNDYLRPVFTPDVEDFEPTDITKYVEQKVVLTTTAQFTFDLAGFTTVKFLYVQNLSSTDDNVTVKVEFTDAVSGTANDLTLQPGGFCAHSGTITVASDLLLTLSAATETMIHVVVIGS